MTAERDRLAAVLETLVDDPEQYNTEGLRQVIQAWADRCLSDANAAIALVTEHGPDGLQMERWRPDDIYEVVLFQDNWDEVWSGRGATFPEALCAAFASYMEAKDAQRCAARWGKHAATDIIRDAAPPSPKGERCGYMVTDGDQCALAEHPDSPYHEMVGPFA